MRIEKDQIIAVAAVAVLIAAFIVGVVLPGRRAHRRLQQQVHRAKEQLGINRASTRSLKKWYAQVLDLRQQVKQGHGYVPRSPELAPVLKGLGGALQAPGVSHQRLRTGDVQGYARYSVIPVTLSFQSRFTTAYDALSRIESMPRLIRMERMELRGDPRKPDQPLEVSLKLSTFFSPVGQAKEGS